MDDLGVVYSMVKRFLGSCATLFVKSTAWGLTTYMRKRRFALRFGSLSEAKRQTEKGKSLIRQ